MGQKGYREHQGHCGFLVCRRPFWGVSESVRGVLGAARDSRYSGASKSKGGIWGIKVLLGDVGYHAEGVRGCQEV